MSTKDPADVYTAVFLVLFFFRYLRLVVNIFAFLNFTGRSVSADPIYQPRDVTFVMPTTFSRPAEHIACLKRIQACKPGNIIIVTSEAMKNEVAAQLRKAGIINFQIFGVSKLNKRRQMLKGLEYVKTEITFFIDDDVFYPSANLPQYLLACFEDPNVGAAGPRQRAIRDSSPSIWNFLGISYLERRNFNTGATNYIDGGISTLSGRTQAVRTSILKNEEFYNYFRNDTFLGRKLTVDDDKALTRFIYSHGWKIALNFHKECTIETTFEEGTKFIGQSIRWARGHWRGNLIVMAKEQYWFTTHLWTLYAIYLSQFQTPALLVDSALMFTLTKALANTDDSIKVGLISFYAFWIFFTKIVKTIPHFLRHPADIKFIPVGIAFSYLHGFINMYALFTTHKTIWGGKAALGPEAVVPEDMHMPDVTKWAALPPASMTKAVRGVKIRKA